MSQPINTDIIPPENPWGLFATWYAAAQQSEPNDPNAMSLATLGANGMPAVRMVLMKDFNEHGIAFFTNRHSRKGAHLAEHPVAAVCFHWKSLRRSVRLEGQIELVSDAESDAYFATRKRGSQIGAWASQQSHLLKDRQELEDAFRRVEHRYEGQTVPRPPHWGGYRLIPGLIEFWQDREFRLHDRIIYIHDSEQGNWVSERLYP